MAEWDYTDPIGPGLGWDAGGYDYGGYSEPIGPGLGWDTGGYPTGDMGYTVNPTQYTSPIGPGLLPGDPTSGGGGDWLSALLSGGGNALASLFRTGGAGGPLLSALGSLGGGAIGSNASSDAARLQSQALNRGIDLQTAQWLQQQQNLAPYLQAGQQGLSTLQSLAGREQPALPGQTASIDPRAYGMPGATPTWAPAQYYGPQAVQAGDYRWTPQQGPQAADYRYTPGNIPQASQYRYTPGAVPTLSGAELLANDPGVAFRQDQERRALEGSAAARGDLLSGGALKALQSRSQDLASQEYGNAFARASQQAQLREGWAQTASQMGYSQAESEARLREQVNQIASQQGWSQAQAEAVFREQMAQQSSQQGFNQALGAQGQQWQQGLTVEQDRQRQQQQFDETYYNRVRDQNNAIYGRDVTANQTAYDRSQNAYRQQLAQFLLPWEQSSTLANLGGQATSMYGNQGANAASGISGLLTQLGSAQAGGATNQANSWLNALQNVGNAGQGYMQQNALLSALSSLNR